MTTPNDEPGFLLRMILDKLTELEKKLDGPTGLVSHEIRLTALETGKKDNRAVWLAFALAALAWVPDLLQLLGK
jgi:hypothetical protein